MASLVTKRVMQACQGCRSSKARCSGDHPCGRCKEQEIDCLFTEKPPLAASLNNKAKDLETRVNDLEARYRPSKLDHRLTQLEHIFDSAEPPLKRKRFGDRSSSSRRSSTRENVLNRVNIPVEKATIYWDEWTRLSQGDTAESWWFGWLATSCSMEQARVNSALILAAGLAVGAKAKGQHDDAAALVKEGRAICRQVLSPTAPATNAGRNIFDLHGCLILACFFSVPISGPLVQLMHYLGVHRSYDQLRREEVTGMANEGATVDRLRLYISVIIYDHLLSLLSGLSAATTLSSMREACLLLDRSRFAQKDRDRVIHFLVDMLSVMDEANRKLNVHARLGSTHYESQCSMAEHYVASLDAVTNTWRTVLSSLRPTSTFKAEDLTGYLLPTGMDPYLQQCEPLVDIPALAFKTIILSYAILPWSTQSGVLANPHRLKLARTAAESAKNCLRAVVATPQFASPHAFAYEFCLVLMSACIKYLCTTALYLDDGADALEITLLLQQVHDLTSEQLPEHAFLEPLQSLLRMIGRGGVNFPGTHTPMSPASSMNNPASTASYSPQDFYAPPVPPQALNELLAHMSPSLGLY